MSAEKFRVVIYTNTCEKKVSYIPATAGYKHRYNAISDGRQWLNYCVPELPYNTTQRAYTRKQLRMERCDISTKIQGPRSVIA